MCVGPIRNAALLPTRSFPLGCDFPRQQHQKICKAERISIAFPSLISLSLSLSLPLSLSPSPSLSLSLPLPPPPSPLSLRTISTQGLPRFSSSFLIPAAQRVQRKSGVYVCTKHTSGPPSSGRFSKQPFRTGPMGVVLSGPSVFSPIGCSPG